MAVRSFRCVQVELVFMKLCVAAHAGAKESDAAGTMNESMEAALVSGLLVIHISTRRRWVCRCKTLSLIHARSPRCRYAINACATFPPHLKLTSAMACWHLAMCWFAFAALTCAEAT